MARSQPFEIDGEHFPNKKAVQERVKTILYSYRDGETLNKEDGSFISDLLTFHPSYEQKRGQGIWYIYVKKNPIYPTMGFWLKRIDGTETDFSYLECLKETPHHKRFERACRVAIAPHVVRFKANFFNGRGDEPYLCPYTEELLTFRTAHVDHAAPNTFQVIFRQFVVDTKLDISGIQVNGKETDGAVQDTLDDKDLEKRWIDYHNERARLQIVSKMANLSHLKRENGRTVGV